MTTFTKELIQEDQFIYNSLETTYSLFEAIKLQNQKNRDRRFLFWIQRLNNEFTQLEVKVLDLLSSNEYNKSVKISKLLHKNLYSHYYKSSTSESKNSIPISALTLLKDYVNIVLRGINNGLIRLIKLNGYHNFFYTQFLWRTIEDLSFITSKLNSDPTNLAKYFEAIIPYYFDIVEEYKPDNALNTTDSDSTNYNLDKKILDLVWGIQNKHLGPQFSLWLVDISFKKEPFYAYNLLDLVTLISQVFNSNDDITVTLGDIYVSSRHFQLHLWFKNWKSVQFAKKFWSEFRTQVVNLNSKGEKEQDLKGVIIESASDNVNAFIKKKPNENAEIESKIELNKAQLQKLRAETPNEDEKAYLQELKKLELEEKRLNLELKRQEITEKKLRNIKEITILLGKKYISLEDVTVNLNDLPFLEQINGKIKIGNDIDNIEENQTNLDIEEKGN